MVKTPEELFTKSNFNLMFKYTESQLKPLAPQYFKEGVEKVYATEDGNFFRDTDKAECDRHAGKYNLKVFTFSEKPKGKVESDKRILGQILEEDEVILKADADANAELNTTNKIADDEAVKDVKNSKK
jgi:hypothetical protein